MLNVVIGFILGVYISMGIANAYLADYQERYYGFRSLRWFELLILMLFWPLFWAA